MTLMRLFFVLLVSTLATACKVTIIAPEWGSVTTESGDYLCAAGSECVVDFEDVLFNETFLAVPEAGYEFVGWKKQHRYFCGGSAEPCFITTEGFSKSAKLLALLDSDEMFFIEPEFADPNAPAERVGFEILEVVSPNEIRAWIAPNITREEFDALELPDGWIKNQPREGGADANGPDGGRFVRSPDAEEDGDILVEELFGFTWFHAATVIETGIMLDDEGLLTGSRVRKYHELTFNAGSTLVLLVSPENTAYFRIGRDADRLTDEPVIPNLWRLVEYTTPENITIQLFDGNLVIRTDNQDAFQGPIAIGDYTLPEPPSFATSGPLPLTTELCEDPGNMDVLAASPVWQAMRRQGAFNPAQVERMTAEPTRGPFYMLNLIRYRDRAQYRDGRETDLTGREANSLYSPVEFLGAIGAAPVFLAAVDTQLEGSDVTWHDVAVVEYPCPVAFFAMVANPDFQDRSIHKDAGVERTIVMVTHLEPQAPSTDIQLPPPPHPPTAEDPAFELVEVLDFRDMAQYEPADGQPGRSGLEAWQTWDAALGAARQSIGVRETATLKVQGAIIGDDVRSWDQATFWYMPSQAGYEAFRGEVSALDVNFHREAALENAYGMASSPLVNNIPGGDSPGGGATPPVTESGVGALCSNDADCVGTGFCVSDGAGVGFCSRNCGAGECGDGYQCCSGCSALAAASLPFTGSACMVEQAVVRLSAPPISCSCE